MGSQSDLAYDHIKEQIFHMNLMPGEKISELQIAAQLNISRTPVHDAVRKLAAEGLITILSKRSASVTKFTDQMIKDIGAVRLIQDILSAELASYYGSEADFTELEYLAESCEIAAAEGNIYKRIVADNIFHLKIAEISGNELLYQQQNSLYQKVHLIHVSQYTSVEDSLLQINHHIPIINNIRKGKLVELRKLICRHIQEFYHLDSYLVKNYGIIIN